MTRFLALIAAGLSQSLSAAACPLELRGTWKSDRPLSMAFASSNSKLAPRTEAFMSALFGHMTLTFDEHELHAVMPEITVPSGGEMGRFAGSEERKPYSVLFCNDYSIVWSANRPFGSEPVAYTFNFVDPDTFWVYTGGTDPTLPDLHAREFFRRSR